MTRVPAPLLIGKAPSEEDFEDLGLFWPLDYRSVFVPRHHSYDTKVCGCADWWSCEAPWFVCERCRRLVPNCYGMDGTELCDGCGAELGRD